MQNIFKAHRLHSKLKKKEIGNRKSFPFDFFFTKKTFSERIHSLTLFLTLFILSCTRYTHKFYLYVQYNKCCFNVFLFTCCAVRRITFFFPLLCLCVLWWFAFCFCWQKWGIFALNITQFIYFVCFVGYAYIICMCEWVHGVRRIHILVFLLNLPATRAYSTHHLALGALIYFAVNILIFLTSFLWCWSVGWLVISFIRAYLHVYYVSFSPLLLPSFIFAFQKAFA